MEVCSPLLHENIVLIQSALKTEIHGYISVTYRLQVPVNELDVVIFMHYCIVNHTEQ